MPKPVTIPADGDVEYTYEIVPTHFTEDKWVQMAEVHPSSPQYVHHAVVYIRPPDSNGCGTRPLACPSPLRPCSDPQDRLDAHGTTSDSAAGVCAGQFAGSLAGRNGKVCSGRIGPGFPDSLHHQWQRRAAIRPASAWYSRRRRRSSACITLQLNDHAFIIPPGADDFRVEAQGTLPHDATLLSLFPHMHLRGKRFEYDIVQPDGSIEPLLRVNYHFHWQLSYRLAEPRLLKAGTRLRAVAWYDNSRNNPHNPDPDATVTWGDQTYQEMMVGFFDVAVPAKMDKEQFFVRPGAGTKSLQWKCSSTVCCPSRTSAIPSRKTSRAVGDRTTASTDRSCASVSDSR